ncbi:MAG: tetratricopeptide repeat protein [Flavobacteriales bacterium]
MVRNLLLFVFLIASFVANAQIGKNYTSQGRYELSKGRYASAIKLFNKVIAFNEFNAEAVFLRAIAKYELEDFIGAEKDFGKTLELNPKNHEAFLYRGVCRSQLHNYPAAFTDYNEAIKLNDEDWRVYSNRALASLLLDRYVDVISDCNKIIGLKKETSYTYLVRGEAKAGLEMYKVAIEDFERAMKLDSTAMPPVLHRGIAFGKLEQYQDAIIDFETSMQIDAASALPTFHRGIVFSEMGRVDDALTDFNSVLQKYPNNAVVLFNRAMAYAVKGKQNLALADYNRVVNLNPKNILGYFNRGILKHNKKDYAGALEDYNQAIALFPEFLDAHENRLQLLQVSGDRSAYNQAKAELDRIRMMIAISDEEAKLEQHVKLMKATELKGEFEPTPQEVGKVQHQKVDVRLLPFYQISAFPETDKNIQVYDGYNRPNYYGTGAIAFVVNGSSVHSPDEVMAAVNTVRLERPNDVIRQASLLALVNDYKASNQLLFNCLKSEEKQVVCYFSSAVIAQMELTKVQDEYAELVGALDVIDPSHQQKVEQLLVAAETNYRQVLTLDPEMSFAHFNYGHLLATAERYEEAELHFGLAASSAGNFIEANYNRGLIRILLGKMEKGCEDMSLAGELGLTDSYNVIKRFCE